MLLAAVAVSAGRALICHDRRPGAANSAADQRRRTHRVPAAAGCEAVPWSLAEIEDVAAALPAWLAALPYLGATAA